ncbi:MAG: type II secretion system protein [Verrucomicrobiales bacterium]|nr:type II secretion system protein [Verrucomicrobiales bacterium]
MKTNTANRTNNAFTMVEMLIVIAVIGIMSALVISSFSNAAQDSRRVVARQQQAAVQNAVNAWVAEKSSRTSLYDARTEYNAKTNGEDKLDEIQRYLDDSTYQHFKDNTSDNNKIQSAALKKTGQHLTLSPWLAGSYPKVSLD